MERMEWEILCDWYGAEVLGDNAVVKYDDGNIVTYYTYNENGVRKDKIFVPHEQICLWGLTEPRMTV